MGTVYPPKKGHWALNFWMDPGGMPHFPTSFRADGGGIQTAQWAIF